MHSRTSRHIRKFRLISALALAAIAGVSLPVSAQTTTYRLLYSFGGETAGTIGVNPWGPLTEIRSGTFLGDTQGTYPGNTPPAPNARGATILPGFGAVYLITPHQDPTPSEVRPDPNWQLFGGHSILLSGLTRASDGKFYGTTAYGGVANLGTAYDVDSTGLPTLLHSFGTGTAEDGQQPNGLVQGQDGNLYGTTGCGGVSIIPGMRYGSGYGTIYRMTPTGDVTILHSFSDGSVPNDGKNPFTKLVQDSSGNLYGLTDRGGSNKGNSGGDGILFKISTSGEYTILHSFKAMVDDPPGNNAFVYASDGNFYGARARDTTNPSNGIFQITPTGHMSNIYDFSKLPKDGDPIEVVCFISAPDGALYGLSRFGGSGHPKPSHEGKWSYPGGGMVFRISPAGQFSIVHEFADGTTPNDGAYPNPNGTLVIGSDGNLYGTTGDGGVYNEGAVFEIVLSSAAP